MSSGCPWRNFVMTEGPLFWGIGLLFPLLSILLPLVPALRFLFSWEVLKNNLWFVSSLHNCVNPSYLPLQSKTIFFSLVLYWVWQQVENATHPLSDHKQSWISEPSLINKGVDQRRRPRRDEARGGERKQEEKSTAASSARWAESSQPFKHTGIKSENTSLMKLSWVGRFWKSFSTAGLRDFFHYLELPNSYKPKSPKVQPRYRGRVSVERVSVLLR